MKLALKLLYLAGVLLASSDAENEYSPFSTAPEPLAESFGLDGVPIQQQHSVPNFDHHNTNGPTPQLLRSPFDAPPFSLYPGPGTHDIDGEGLGPFQKYLGGLGSGQLGGSPGSQFGGYGGPPNRGGSGGNPFGGQGGPGQTQGGQRGGLPGGQNFGGRGAPPRGGGFQPQQQQQPFFPSGSGGRGGGQGFESRQPSFGAPQSPSAYQGFGGPSPGYYGHGAQPQQQRGGFPGLF